ncbi:MAG: thioesterase family protein [Sulfobacillus sp.]|nr:thioesterase family protein [Sulfobacillus sp.]
MTEHAHKVHHWSTRVRWGETDAAGFVFYPNYYAWFDQASHEFLDALGFPSADWFNRQGIGMPLLEAHATFHRPLFFGDSITVVTWVENLSRKSFRLGHQVLKSDGTIAASGYEVRAWVQFRESPAKAVPLPDALREQLALYHRVSDQKS